MKSFEDYSSKYNYETHINEIIYDDSKNLPINMCDDILYTVFPNGKYWGNHRNPINMACKMFSLFYKNKYFEDDKEFIKHISDLIRDREDVFFSNYSLMTIRWVPTQLIPFRDQYVNDNIRYKQLLKNREMGFIIEAINEKRSPENQIKFKPTFMAKKRYDSYEFSDFNKYPFTKEEIELIRFSSGRYDVSEYFIKEYIKILSYLNPENYFKDKKHFFNYISSKIKYLKINFADPKYHKEDFKIDMQDKTWWDIV